MKSYHYENLKKKKKIIMAAFDVAQNSYWCCPARSVDILRYSSDNGFKL